MNRKIKITDNEFDEIVNTIAGAISGVVEKQPPKNTEHILGKLSKEEYSDLLISAGASVVINDILLSLPDDITAYSKAVKGLVTEKLKVHIQYTMDILNVLGITLDDVPTIADLITKIDIVLD